MEPTVQERAAALDMIERMENLLSGMMVGKEADRKTLFVLNQTICDINQALFPGSAISDIYCFDSETGDREAFERAFGTWKTFVKKLLEKTLWCKSKIESDFEVLMAYLETVRMEELEQLLKDNFALIKAESPQVYELLVKIYMRYEGFWGALNPEKGIFDCIIQRAEALKKHTKEWRWFFTELGDNRSKETLYHVLANWITFQPGYLQACRESVYKDYFDLDLIPELAEEEVFVDLGGYIGDTVEDFINAYMAKYKRIYTYEINPHNLECLRESVKRYPNVVIGESAAGEKEDTRYLDLRIGGSSTTLSAIGEQEVRVVSLDEDIEERITWVKMDIEGSEQSALRGLKKHIEREKPKLTICTYHNNEDIWKIPMMVKEYRPDYKLYFRYNGKGIHPSEYVLFAL